MKNIDKVISYTNGIMAYYNYLCGNFGAPLSDLTQIQDINNIRYAKASLIALFFTTKKEEMVEQESINDFSSKLVDEALINSIETIATKNNDIYEIGSYKEKNPANIVAFIRNSFAHGRYYVDTENNKIVIDNQGITFDLEFDKLYYFVCSSVCNLIKYPKTKKIERIHAQNSHILELGIDKITNRSEAELIIKTSLLKKYTLFSLNNDYITPGALESFEEMLNTIKTVNDDEITQSFMIPQFRKIANKNNLEIMIKKEKVKGIDLKEVLDLLDNTIGFYEIDDLNIQINYILSCLIEKKEPNYGKEGFLNGLILNMNILKEMETNNEFDLCKLIGGNASFYSTSTECLVSSLLSKFNTIYTYPLETIYTHNNEYRLERTNEFDFSKLDLDFLKPKIINVDKSLLNEQETKLKPNISEKEALTKLIETTKENLEKAFTKGNLKAIAFLDTKLKEFQESFEKVSLELNNDRITLEKIKEDYKINPKYYYNRAIIEGLRNSIAHGNVRIKRFEGGEDFDDTVINFQDIYKGEVTFEINMTLLELEKLIGFKTTEPITNYLLEKESNKKVSKINILKKSNV